MLAQVGFGWSLGEVLIAIVIIAAIVAVVYVALKGFGIPVPPWAIQILWIVLLAVLAVFAIKLILSMW